MFFSAEGSAISSIGINFNFGSCSFQGLFWFNCSSSSCKISRAACACLALVFDKFSHSCLPTAGSCFSLYDLYIFLPSK